MDNTDLLETEIKNGKRLTYEEAVELSVKAAAGELCALADNLRGHFTGNDFDTCSIMNARSGKCSEDCKWCSQSVFHKTDIEIYPLVSETEAVEMALHNSGKGVKRFSLVTSGRKLTDAEIGKCCDTYKRIGEVSDIKLCASMGLLTKEQLRMLFESGVKRYHCNLETAPSYFPELCTTHTTEEKIRTIKWAQEVGMEVCSGGIIGMGESMEQRVELAVTLRELGIRSIPVNILNPIKGTALENTEPLSDDEIIRTFALFRIINPEACIRFAGGRTLIKRIERELLHCGVNGSIVGDMLTTSGSDIETDKKTFSQEGFSL